MIHAFLAGAGPGFWLPRQGSTGAAKVDFLFHAVTNISIFFFVLITVVLFTFIWKYRARPGHKARPSADHNQALEVTWTVIPDASVTRRKSSGTSIVAIPFSTFEEPRK